MYRFQARNYSKLPIEELSQKELEQNIFRRKTKFSIMVSSIIVVLFVIFIISQVQSPKDTTNQNQEQDLETEEYIEDSLSPALKKGKQLSHNMCEGEGSVVLNSLPMREEDFAFLIPYGLMIGAHVTPIDHQYFSPIVFNSPRDTYEVRSMADAKIVEISHRIGGDTDEYRIVFSHTCTFFTYYDLVTSLEPSLKSAFDTNEQNNYAPMDFEVKEGDLIGYIGGQTLDFAVWNTEQKLSGFVVPEHYDGEAWKIHTVDPYEYYSEELKDILTRKNLRTAEPIAGKIDYDIEGKLVGTWFVENTGGYAGIVRETYYSTHLSFVYDHLDPQGIIISIGNFQGEPRQFGVQGNSPDPATVSIETGLVKYDLVDFSYLEENGSYWDRNSLVKNLTFVEGREHFGCLLAQVEENNKLLVETFPGEVCSIINTFTDQSIQYER